MRQGLAVLGSWLAALLLSCAVMTGLAAAQPVLDVGPGDQTLGLNGHMALLLDPAGTLTPEQAMAPAARDRFRPLPISLSLGYDPATAWLRFALRNSGPDPRSMYLDLEPSFVDHIDVFLPAPGGYRTVRLGDHVRIADKPVFSMNNVAPVDLPPGAVVEVFVRVQTTSSLLLRATLRSERSLERSGTEMALVLGLYVGLAFVVGAINLIFWWWVGWPAHFWYAAYVISLGVVSAVTMGVVPVWIFPDHPAWSDLAVGCANGLSCAVGCYFAIAVLELRQRSRPLYYLYHAIALFCLVGAASPFLGFYQQMAGPMLIAVLVVLFVAMVESYRFARQGSGPARLFLISFAAQVFGLSFTIFRVVGLLPTMEWTDYGYQVASAIHMILMNIGLAQRMKDADALALAAQAEALALAQQAESRAQAIAVERTRDFEAAKLRAEAALAAEQEAQRTQVRFIDVISHQYRTPLSVIAANIEGIGISLGEADRANQRRIDRIRRAVGRLVAMIDVSLDRSRLDGAPLEPRRRRIAPGPMLRQAVQRVRDTLGDRTIALQLDPAIDGATIDADPEMIELALINLIENAVKFSRPDQPVDVVATVRDDALHVAVRDRGIGIPPADRDQVFQKFYRASNASDRPGVGIGLQLVAQLIHAHGGTIRVDSVENEGTTFTVVLRLAPVPAGA